MTGARGSSNMSVDPQGSTKVRRRGLGAELTDLSRTYMRRSLELVHSVAVGAGVLKSHGESLLWLRDRLEQANRRVAECEQLVAGWRELLHRQEADGSVVASSRDMLKVFCADLEEAISEKERAEKLIKKTLRKFFVGAKGRRPYSDDEVDEWLASAEGKAATAFEPAPLPESARKRQRS